MSSMALSNEVILKDTWELPALSSTLSRSAILSNKRIIIYDGNHGWRIYDLHKEQQNISSYRNLST